MSTDRFLAAEVEALRQQNAELRARLDALEGDFGCFALPGDELAHLTKTQRAIVKMLHDRSPSIVTKEGIHQMLYALRPGDAAALKIIDVLICKIRPHLTCWRIDTAWGIGFALRPLVPARSERAHSAAGLEAHR